LQYFSCSIIKDYYFSRFSIFPFDLFYYKYLVTVHVTLSFYYVSLLFIIEISAQFIFQNLHRKTTLSYLYERLILVANPFSNSRRSFEFNSNASYFQSCLTAACVFLHCDCLPVESHDVVSRGGSAERRLRNN